MPETPAEPVDEGEAVDQPRTPGSPRQSLGFFQPRPIVVFITGGAWIIGYKAWSLMMGRVFQVRLA